MSRGIHRRLDIQIDDNLKRRFWAGVDQRDENSCWEWKKGLRNGYGAIKVSGKVLSAHRISYVLHHGEPPDGHVIRHACDNKKCCNPNHLVSGTPRDNVLDAVDRGQFRSAHGELHPSSRFTDLFVKAVWELRRQTGWGHRRIAKALDLEERALKNIFEKKNYKHLIPDWAKADKSEP